MNSNTLDSGLRRAKGHALKGSSDPPRTLHIVVCGAAADLGPPAHALGQWRLEHKRQAPPALHATRTKKAAAPAVTAAVEDPEGGYEARHIQVGPTRPHVTT